MKKLTYGDVLNHAIKITEYTVTDVFVIHNSHINTIEIRIHPYGWNPKSEDFSFNSCIGDSIKYNEDDIHTNCKEMIKFIDEHTKDV